MGVKEDFNDALSVGEGFGLNTVVIEQPSSWLGIVRLAAATGCKELREFSCRVVAMEGQTAWIAVSMSDETFAEIAQEWLAVEGTIYLRGIIGWKLYEIATMHLKALGYPRIAH